jgi:ribosomal protein S18 acetylase RimI-like enzyme
MSPYIELVLGTRRGFRGRGLGRAMLLSGLSQLKQSGVETALLGVDSQNPSGALQLYKSVGFSQRDVSTTFSKSVT